MIIFHQGMPGSGKSYEAVVNQIIPALKKGRRVYSNIRGLNHEQIAQVAELELDVVKDLLVQIEWNDSKKIHELVTPDSLIVFDEIQDFWPSKSTPKMPNDVQQWFTQHRHYGQDIVAIGQDMRDVDPIIRRRIDQRLDFKKLDALGAPTRYSWSCYKATSSEKFQKINDGQGKYDAKYFGTYQSHRPETTNTDTHQDDRSNVFKNRAFRLYVPAAFIAGVVAVFYLYNFFHNKAAFGAANASAVHHVETIDLSKIPPENLSNPYAVRPTASAPAASPVAQEKHDENPDKMLEVLNKLGRPRLSGLIVSSKTGAVSGIVEWLDDSFHVKESMTFVQLAELGYSVKPLTDGVMLYDPKGNKTYISAWPIDPFGRVSNIDRDHLSGQPVQQQQAPQQTTISQVNERSSTIGGDAPKILDSRSVGPISATASTVGRNTAIAQLR